MGLTSLPILNKLGYRNYWENLWWGNKSYIKQTASALFINHLTLLLNSEKSFSVRFVNSSNTQAYFESKWKYIKAYWFQKNIFNGDVWYLQYQNCVIITPLFFRLANFRQKKFTIKKNIHELVHMLTFGHIFLKIDNYFNEDYNIVTLEGNDTYNNECAQIINESTLLNLNQSHLPALINTCVALEVYVERYVRKEHVDALFYILQYTTYL